MDLGAGASLESQLSFEQFRRQIAQMSYEQRGQMLEKLAYDHFVVQPAMKRLAMDLKIKAPADWGQTAGAWALEDMEQAETCAESHW